MKVTYFLWDTAYFINYSWTSQIGIIYVESQLNFQKKI